MSRLFCILVVLGVCSLPGGAAADDFDFPPGDLNRDALIRAVLERNPEIDIAHQAWRAALEQRAEVSVLDDPRLSYSLAPLSLGGGARFGNTLSVSQRFPFPGKLGIEERIAQARADAAHLGIEVVRLELALLASELYFDYYFAQQSLAINGQHVELLERIKRIATARYASGLAAQQDPIQAEVELAHLEHDRVVIESHREVLVSRINALLHRSPSAPVPAPPNSLALPVGPDWEHSTQLEASALRGRAELRAQDSTIRAWETETELKQKNLRPDFEAMGKWDTMWNATEHQWMVGASINLPVRRKRIRASIARAEAGRRAAGSERLRLEDKIRAEVRESRLRLRESREVIDLYTSRLLPASHDLVRAALAGFETGGNSFLAVIEAEKNQRTTELEYQRFVADSHQRLAELDRAVGRLPDGLERAGGIAANAGDEK